LSAELPPISKNTIKENTFCYDLMDSNKETVFIKWAIENGASGAADGLGMLVEQAAEAFYIWRGKRPDIYEVIKALQEQLTA